MKIVRYVGHVLRRKFSQALNQYRHQLDHWRADVRLKQFLAWSEPLAVIVVLQLAKEGRHLPCKTGKTALHNGSIVCCPNPQNISMRNFPGSSEVRVAPELGF